MRYQQPAEVPTKDWRIQGRAGGAMALLKHPTQGFSVRRYTQKSAIVNVFVEL